ncbi:MAG TPA: glutaredoxin domain-containing protein [Candidatus Omnitrophota bacterium]|nr:glutaredoxin domain-containing protein [Candidatus Omnitrophota bacterium]
MIFKQPLLFMLTGLMLTGCVAHGKFRPAEPVSGNAYVTLYGMENCSACQKFKRALNKEKIPYTFKDINDANAQSEMYSRMEKAGLDTGYYLYPVVDVNGEVASYPSVDDTIDRYRRSGISR